VDVRMLFNAPTLEGLAAQVSQQGAQITVPANLITADCQKITPELLPLISLTQEEIDQLVCQVPGGTSNVQDIYPLAPLQEGILFHHLMEQQGDPYLLPTLLAFDTRERLEGFLSGLNSLIERHDILRTAMVWEGLSQPVQVVYRRVPEWVDEISLEGAEDVAQQLHERFDPAHYPLDVSRAPLMR